MTDPKIPLSYCLALLFWVALPAFVFADVPTNPLVEKLLEQGEDAYSQGRYGEALSDYQQALQVNGEEARALFGQGMALAKLGQWEKALTVFQAASEENPENPKVWLGLGWAQEKAGHLEEAIHCYQKVGPLDPGGDDGRLAAKRLSQLGARPLPVPILQPEAAAVPAKKDFKWISLGLEAGGGYNDNLGAATTISHTIPPYVAVADGFDGLSASLGLTSAPAGEPRATFTGFGGFNTYFNHSAFNQGDLSGRAAFEANFLSAVQGQAGLGGELWGQNEGVGYASDFAWAALKSTDLGPLQLSARYTYTEETYSNYTITPYALAHNFDEEDPNDHNHQIDARVQGKPLPWLVLFGQYQFKDNEAFGTGFQYISNGFGGGAEAFWFEGDNLLGGLQLAYLATGQDYLVRTSIDSSTGGLNNDFERENIQRFSAKLDVPFEKDWSAGAYYWYESDLSNVKYFSYVNNILGLTLSYDPL